MNETAQQTGSVTLAKRSRSWYQISTGTMMMLLTVGIVVSVGGREGWRRYEAYQKQIETGQIIDKADSGSDKHRRDFWEIETAKLSNIVRIDTSKLYSLPHLKTVDFGEKKVIRGNPFGGTNVYSGLMEFLQRCPELEKVSFANCTVHIDNETLRWLGKNDVEIHGFVELFSAGKGKESIPVDCVEVINEWKWKKLRFNGCKFKPDAIEALDFDINQQVLQFANTPLTANEIIETFGADIERLSVTGENELYLYGNGKNYIGAAASKRLPVKERIFDFMPKLTSVGFTAHMPSYLAAIENCQPKVEVSFEFSSLTQPVEIKRTVENTPSLTGLIIGDCGGYGQADCPVSFTPKHQLERLSIASKCDCDQAFFEEVGKLQKLKELIVRTDDEIGAEIEPLAKLPSLRKIRFETRLSKSLPDPRVNSEAAKLLEQHGFKAVSERFLVWEK